MRGWSRCGGSTPPAAQRARTRRTACLDARVCTVRPAPPKPSPPTWNTSSVWLSNRYSFLERLRRSQSATFLSAEPVATTNSLKGLKARQLTSAECASTLLSWAAAGTAGRRQAVGGVAGSAGTGPWPAQHAMHGGAKRIRNDCRRRTRVAGLADVPDDELAVVAHRPKQAAVPRVPGNVLHHAAVALVDVQRGQGLRGRQAGRWGGLPSAAGLLEARRARVSGRGRRRRPAQQGAREQWRQSRRTRLACGAPMMSHTQICASSLPLSR